MGEKLMVVGGVVLCGLASAAVGSSVEEVGPFSGDLFDGFETYGDVWTDQIDLFGGEVTLTTSISPSDAIWVAGSSIFGGVTVQRRSGQKMLGTAAPAIWEFNTPALTFGGYFATNSGGDDATVDFYDQDGQLIDSMVATIPDNQTWVWNGWESSTPIARVEVTGNGAGGAFIDYDDMELIVVPEPSGLVLMALGGLAVRRRR